MKKFFVICFLLCWLALSWGQQQSPPSDTQEPNEQAASSTNSSLLWQIASEAMTNSLQSFEALGPSLNSIENLMKKSLPASQKAWQLSVKLEQIMNEALLNSDSQQKSLTYFAEGMTLVTKELRRKTIEVWVWRIATIISTGGILYFVLR